MKFHNVLEEVFGTSERIRVLRVLMRYRKEFTSRELSSYCDVSVRGVIDILSSFERHGFVKSRRAGKAILWKMDENHYLTKSLIPLTFGMDDNLVNQLKQNISAVVRKFPVQRAVIYGSLARGEERPDSDIDLLLVVREKGKWVEKLQAELGEKILKRFGNTLSALVYTPNEYKNMPQNMKKEMENSIAVVGD